MTGERRPGFFGGFFLGDPDQSSCAMASISTLDVVMGNNPLPFCPYHEISAVNCCFD